MVHSLQETKYGPLLLSPLMLPQPTQIKFKQQQPQQKLKKQNSPSMKVSSERASCISVIYNKFLYAYMPHKYVTVN